MWMPQKCFSGTGKEKSSFARTCNRLSLFIKENGSLKDIGINASFDVKGKPETSSPATETKKTSVERLSNMENAVQTSEKMERSINHLPRYVSLDSFCKPDDSPNRTVSSERVPATGSKTSQMTIFYSGQIVVFDHISGDKAREMMLAATGASSSSDNQIQNRIPSASTSNAPYETFRSRERVLRGPQVSESDLPIARRSSLHKFLATRKERAAPYQLHNRLIANASSNRNFDLNF